MKKVAAFLFLALLFAPFSRAQSDSSIHVNQYPGANVGIKVQNAMASCSSAPVPCILVIDASLASAAAGTMPSLCANCYLQDWRNGPPTLTAGTNCSNTSSDFTTVQGLLTAARSGFAAATVTANGVCNTNSGTLLVSSNTKLVISPGAKVSATGNTPLVENYSYANPVRTESVTTTASSATVTGTCSSADIGRAITIPGAGDATVVSSAPGTGTITACSGGTSMTVSATMFTHVTATATIFNEDSNIEITGGAWSKTNSGGGTDIGLHAILCVMCNNFFVHDISVSTSSAKYAIAMLGGTHLTASNIYCVSCSSDGVHVNGPASDISISKVRGNFGDNSVALIGSDWAGYNFVGGIIQGFTIDGTVIDSCTTVSGNCGIDIVSGNQSALIEDGSVTNTVNFTTYDTVLSPDDPSSGGYNYTYRVKFDGIYAPFAAAPVVMYGSGNSDMTVINAYGAASSGTPIFITAEGSWANFSVENLHCSATGTADLQCFSVPSGSAIDHALVETRSSATGTGYVIGATVAGTVNHLSAECRLHAYTGTYTDCVLVYTGTIGDLVVTPRLTADSGTAATNYALSVHSGTVSTSLLIANGFFDVNDTTGSALMYVFGTSSSVPAWNVSGIGQTKGLAGVWIAASQTAGAGHISTSTFTGTNNVLFTQSALDVTLNGVTTASLAGYPFYTNGASLTIRGAGDNFGTAGPSLSRQVGTETVEVFNPTVPNDASILTVAAGESVYNTNSAFGRIGPMSYDGTRWQAPPELGTGAPSGSCGVGTLYDNYGATSASTVLYVCYPANTWTAITVP